MILKLAIERRPKPITLLKNENKLSKRDTIISIVITVLSVINFPACIFNLLALKHNGEDKYLEVINPNYQEKAKPEKKVIYKSTSFILTVISLVGIMLFSIIGSSVESVGGTVEVSDHT
jgi:hypothetical protein